MATRTAIGGWAAISRASAFASSRYSSTGTTRETSPSAYASAAVMLRPVRISSIARDFPMARVRRWVPPAPGIRPRRISGWPNRAVSEATMMSQSMASSHPPPSAYPLTAAITGLPIRRIRSHCWNRYARTMSAGVASTNSCTSAPAANARGLPVTTRHRTASSRSRASIAEASSSMSAWLSALRTCGRFSVTVAIPPAEVTRMSASAMGGSLEEGVPLYFSPPLRPPVARESRGRPCGRLSAGSTSRRTRQP